MPWRRWIPVPGLAAAVAICTVACSATAGGNSEKYLEAVQIAEAARPAPRDSAVYHVDATAVEIAPGENIQQLIERHPPGTTFLVKAGVHRTQSVIPREGDVFLGEAGAILNGSRTVANFFPVGPYWLAFLNPVDREPHGQCLKERPRCAFPNDVFVDDVLQQHVARVEDVGPGSYLFEPQSGRLYLGTDPEGRRVEIATALVAFDGKAANVTVRGLTIEKYANRAQYGAIMAAEAPGWVIEDNIVRWNHGLGIAVGPGGQARRNTILRNGQLGISADESFCVIERNEIAYNNSAGFLPGWEAGGSKFAETQDLMVRGNYVHHNFGFGLWTDVDNIRTTYENNVVTDNTHAGIFHEISQAAAIRNNHVYRNGKGDPDWLWGAQILIAGSRDVDVRGNTVVVDLAGGHGITLIQQDRGLGRYGPRQTRSVTIHHNDITYLGDVGLSGAAADHDEAAMFAGNNLFDYNSYHFRSEPTRWQWRGVDLSLAAFRAAGHETHGAVDSQVAAPSK